MGIKVETMGNNCVREGKGKERKGKERKDKGNIRKS
jgi:hypothetical protein